MTNEDYLLELYCLTDDALKQVMPPGGLRQRGFAPRLSDAEVITIELAGEFWGFHTDKGIFQEFQQHYLAEFPALADIDRTTFVRQGANLAIITLHVLENITSRFPAPMAVDWLIDSMPMPVCRFARARQCRLFKGIAAYGYDHLNRQIFYGFKLHLRAIPHGAVAGFEVAPANASDISLVPEILPKKPGTAFADRNYWDPDMYARLAQRGFYLEAPFKKRSSDPAPERSHYINSVRQGIETIIGQLASRFEAKVIRARDVWHMCHRTARKVLAHAAAIFINLKHHHPPLQLACLFEK